jgi:hypothetical protein
MDNLNKTQPSVKSGTEPLSYHNKDLNFTLLDFWRWYSSDILSNATRGILAEFVIATALGIDITVVRDEWAAYDLTTPDGIKVEVKSAAYLQTWFQRKLSTISFSTKAARYWDAASNEQALISKRHADVYVFCHLKHEDKSTVNPLNLNHWDFYVLSTHELNNYTRSQHSITLKSLQKLAPAMEYDELKAQVESKHELNIVA